MRLFWCDNNVIVETNHQNSPVAGNITPSHVVLLLKRFSDELNLLDAPLASFSGAELDAFDVFHLCHAFFERAGSFLFCQNPNTDVVD